jgi:anti-sigma B factor antagonist
MAAQHSGGCVFGFTAAVTFERVSSREPDGERMLEAKPEAGYEGEFRIEEDRLSPKASLLCVHGDADLGSAPQLRDRLRVAIDRGASDVVVDLTKTTLLDSSALGVLLGATKRLREGRGDLQVVAGPEIRRLFEITMLDEVFTLHGTRAAALAAVSGGAR